MISHSTSARAITHSQQRPPRLRGRRVDRVHPCVGEHAREITRSAASGRCPCRRALASIACAEGDVRQRQAAMPEQDGFVVALATRLAADDDLAQLGVERRGRQLAGVDMRAQAAELSALALAPVVDHDLVHDVGQRQFDGAHRAVGNDQRARLDPVGHETAARARRGARLRRRCRRRARRFPSRRSRRPACRDRRDKAARRRRSRLSGRREWTRISSKSNSRSSRRTFQ